MRLDHLLSKEMGEVGVALLLICQGQVKKLQEALIAKQLARASRSEDHFLVAMRLGDTPVLIPNTMVKTQAADGTSLETVRESRWPPGYKKLKNTKQIRCKCSGDSYRYRQKMSNNLSVPTLSARKCCYDSWFYQ